MLPVTPLDSPVIVILNWYTDTPIFKYSNALYYMQAVAISKLMLPFLNGDKEKRKSYLKTMNNLSGEYNNVAVIMCQQYLDRFPESYSELEETFSPQYLVSEADIYLYDLD